MLFLLIVREKRLWAELAFDLLNAVVFSSDMVQVVHPQLKSYVRALLCVSALVTVKFVTAMIFNMCFEVLFKSKLFSQWGAHKKMVAVPHGLFGRVS